MNLLIGPASSGKTEHLLSRAADAIEAGAGIVHLVAPSLRSGEVLFERLQSVLRSREPRRLEQVITSFPKLYVSLLGRAQRDVSWISPGERNRLIGRITVHLAESGRLEYFAGTADCPGVASAISRLIDELWRAGTGPEEFSAAALTRSAKDRDLALVFTHYRQALSSSGLIDPEGAGLAAVRLLEGRTAAGKLVSREAREKIARSYSMIAADDFDFYSPVQVRLLSLLAAHGTEASATLTYEEGRSVHLWQEPTRERFRTAGVNLIRFSSRPGSALQLAAAGFMRDGPEGGSEEKLPENGKDGRLTASEVSILSAADRACEVRAVAREIKKLVLNHGVALDEIALVCRSLPAYSHVLERTFNECAIPLKIDSAQALSGNQLGVSIMRLLDLSSRGFPRRSVVDLLRSPYFDLTHVGLDASRVELLDAISLDQNVTRGHDLWMSALFSASTGSKARTAEADVSGNRDEPDEKRMGRYRSAALALEKFFYIVTPPGTGQRSEMAAFARRLLEILKVRERAAGSPFAERDLGALKAFEAALTDVSRDASDYAGAGDSDRAPNAELSWPQFYSELERAFNACTFERPHVRGPAVVAQEAHNLHPRSYRAIFVLGLVEGEFPAKSSETAPYTRNERAELRDSGIDLTESTSDAGADLLQFYKVISRCGERLYLSSPRTDSSGGELLRSYLIDEMISAGPVREYRINHSHKDAGERNPAEAASLDELALMCARSLRGAAQLSQRATAHDVLSRSLPAWNAALRGAAREADRILFRGSPAHRGLISDPSLKALLASKLGKNHLWSATQINDYGVCPFRFFAGHLLRLAPVNEPVEGFVSNRLGSAYHKILERYYSEGGAREENLDARVVDEYEEIAGKITEEVIGRMLEEGTIRSSPFLEFEKDFMKRQVARLIQAEERWRESEPARPSAFEVSFGLEGTPPLVIEDGDDEVRVCGTIDRIDESAEGCVVIDYKTRRTPVHYDDALNGRDLQLPIYMLAVSRAVTPGREVRSAYYLHINSRRKGSEFPGGDERLSLKAITDHAEQRIREYASGARAGEYPIRPNNRTCAPGCGFRLMCRVQSIGSDGN
ncbi:MAG TPA: PD-(D/E)XK nuclease family protein [Blastocatellia bacterium]|jgi:ATP-dependent helicase/DNAse subunit B|nr:PD-(D/E)XK nuclease family protein [Blastocatellia bacterium]